MFIKRLRILEGERVFREVVFHKGLNLIVDETSDGNYDTGNNVGKTTVLRFIDMCLGGDEKRGGDWNTSMRPNGVTYQYGREIDNKLEYGIAGGLGLELSTKIGHFILEGRYYYGLSDIYDNSKKGFFGRSANQSIVIRGAYLLDLIKTKE